MTFVLNGTLVTQSGTDSDLGGLADIAGVTAETNSDHTRYILDGLQLEVAGNLSISPTAEMLYFKDNQPSGFALAVASGGILTVGSQTTHGGEAVYSFGTWLKTTRKAASGWSTTDLSFLLKTGGTMNWSGGAMDVASPPNFGAVPVVGSGQIYCRATNQQRARVFASAAGLFENLELFGNGFNPRDAGASFKNVTMYDAELGFTSAPNGLVVEDYNYIGRGVVYFWASGGRNFEWFLKNPRRGMATEMAGGPADAVGSYILATKSVEFAFVNGDGLPIEGVKVYSREHDDGNRRLLGAKDFTAVDSVSVLSGVNGKALVQDFRLGYFFRDTPDFGKVYFTKNGDDSDVQDFYFVAYGYKLAFEDVALKGTGTLAKPKPLVEDTAITQADPAVVAAYSSIDTAHQFYDAAKLYLFENFSGQTAPLATRFDNVVDVGGYDVVINANAASAFAFDGNTITIKSSQFAGDLITTGSIDLINDASSVGAIVSSSFDSYLRFNDIETWVVYPSNEDRDAKTNALGNGVGQQLYRFLYGDDTTYYLRVISGGVELFMSVVPTGAGETSVTLSVQAQLVTLTEKVEVVRGLAQDAADLSA